MEKFMNRINDRWNGNWRNDDEHTTTTTTTKSESERPTDGAVKSIGHRRCEAESLSH